MPPPPATHPAGGGSEREVKGPFTALEQAETIKRLAALATEGRTYGELDADDPAAETALKASLL